MMRSIATEPIEIIQALENDHQPPLYAKREIAIVRGEGAYLFDSTGKRYLDAMSNYGVAALGHADPEYTTAMQEQLATLTTCHQSFYNDQRAASLAALQSIMPAELDRFFMSNSGAEAIEAALKFAIATTGRKKIVAAKKGYHGRTLGALAATAEPRYRDAFADLLIEATHVTYNDPEALEAAVSEETAAVILEPIQGEGEYLSRHEGVPRSSPYRRNDPRCRSHRRRNPEWLPNWRAIRLPRQWRGSGHHCLGQGGRQRLSGGCHGFGQRDRPRSYRPECTGTTYGANPLAARAIIESIHAYQSRGLFEQSSRIGQLLMDGIRGLNKSKIRDVRGKGLMIGVELKERVTPTIKGLQEAGVLVLPATPVVFRLLPPLIWQEQQVEEFLTAMDAVL